MVINDSPNFFQTIPAMNWDKNILPKLSKFSTEVERSFLNHSLAFPVSSMRGKALQETSYGSHVS
jgi:hypothetical protein